MTPADFRNHGHALVAGITHLGRVLDDGCGGGGMSVSFAEEAETVVAIDLADRAIERHEIVCPRIDAFYTEHKYCGEDDLFGSGHPPDTLVAMALAYHAFKTGRQPGDYGVTI